MDISERKAKLENITVKFKCPVTGKEMKDEVRAIDFDFVSPCSNCDAGNGQENELSVYVFCDECNEAHEVVIM